LSNSKTSLAIRTLHDVGVAAWFGGTLMGAVGLNGAASDAADKGERAKIAADGWARWAPVNTAAIAAHLIGGAGLIVANRDRVKEQAGAGRNTVIKTVLTGVAIAATAYSGALGAKIAAADGSSAEGATEPSALTDSEVALAQKRLKTLQWIIPAVTGAILVLGAEQGEQQKPEEQARGFALKRLRSLAAR
jgi:hypothetical protein